jgi:hypothetical protein
MTRGVLIMTLVVAGAASADGSAPAGSPPRAAPGERLEVPPPPFSDGIYPCSACHATFPANRRRRALTDMHGDITLTHDQEHRWCLDCHDAEDRDSLHLASGERVPFEEFLLLRDVRTLCAA